ncbi:purine-binding chemotaxis protein CheW [Azospirillum lipoferum]|uniref:Chemotaxis protein CheW n=1 Tax=Azospirillum lipoferum TaxID=193 RepID=A0A5A9GKB0_AZOLI|nr:MULTISPECIES: chemotaxis protein CheW [Azospirillum]KAA0594826.1 chemotaxis protein CheW [Azospirillum lipoferum]MCP1612848.1 purine-binding chemotaxis protein CheW [Azospirillum lipoferum]MDW5532013.1 chemotaxis protein CheW [Azospirillum sp. NL1]
MTDTETRSFEALTLGLGGEIFAIDANSVHEILDIVPQTEVPGAPPLVSHLINVRGKVVPLADLRIRFGMECTPPTIDTRIVVVEIELDEEPTVVGLLADKVHEVTSISGASIEGTPDIGMRWNPELIKGIGKRGDDFIVIPDIVRIFTTH